MIHFAIDAVTGIALPDGEIAGMSDSVAGLRAAGFGAATYTGDRLAQVDETTANWNHDCIPGWYLVGGAVQIIRPLDALGRKKRALTNLHERLHAWADGLDRKSRGQPIRRVNAGHQWLFYKHYSAYLIGTNQVDGVTYTDDQIITWANQSMTGAADTRNVAEFYAAEPLTGALADGPTGPMTWVNPATGAKVDLVDSLVVTPESGISIDDIDLADGAWIEELTS